MSKVGKQKDTRPWRQIKLTLPEDVAVLLEEAVEMARVHELACNPVQAIEALCVEFLQTYNLAGAIAQIELAGGEHRVERLRKLEEKKDSGFRCVNCEHSKNLTVHHLWLKSYHGPERPKDIHDPDNLVCICNDCHESIHDIEGNWRDMIEPLKTKRKQAHRQVQQYGHRITTKHGKREQWI